MSGGSSHKSSLGLVCQMTDDRSQMKDESTTCAELKKSAGVFPDPKVQAKNVPKSA